MPIRLLRSLFWQIVSLALVGVIALPQQSNAQVTTHEWVDSCRSILETGNEKFRRDYLEFFKSLDLTPHRDIKICFSDKQELHVRYSDGGDSINLIFNKKKIEQLETVSDTPIDVIVGLIITASLAADWEPDMSDDIYVSNHRVAFFTAGEIVSQARDTGRFIYSEQDFEYMTSVYMLSDRAAVRDSATLFERGWRAGRTQAEKKHGLSASKPDSESSVSMSKSPRGRVDATPYPTLAAPKPVATPTADVLDNLLRQVGINPDYANAFERGWAMAGAVFGLIVLPFTVLYTLKRFLRRRAKRRGARAVAATSA